MTRIILFTLAFPFFISSCQNSSSANSSIKYIDLQPFSGMPAEEINYVYSELRKVYPYVILKKNIHLPPSAFYKPRNRYRADSLIHFLHSNTGTGHVTIGLQIRI